MFCMKSTKSKLTNGPRTVEAFQWNGLYGRTEEPEWFSEWLGMGRAFIDVKHIPFEGVKYDLVTKGKIHPIYPGDYVIRYENSLQVVSSYEFIRKWAEVESKKNECASNPQLKPSKSLWGETLGFHELKNYTIDTLKEQARILGIETGQKLVGFVTTVTDEVVLEIAQANRGIRPTTFVLKAKWIGNTGVEITGLHDDFTLPGRYFSKEQIDRAIAHTLQSPETKALIQDLLQKAEQQ